MVTLAEFKFEIFYIYRQLPGIKNGSKSCWVEGPQKSLTNHAQGIGLPDIRKQICNQSKIVTIQGSTIVQLFNFILIPSHPLVITSML